MSIPEVKGWCPGAYRPMMSGDGLVFRVRPLQGELSRNQGLGLADIAMRYGSGVIDLTNRANLQIRGVSEQNSDTVLDRLNDLRLLDADPALEMRRNIITTPFWQADDENDVLAKIIRSLLPNLPELPAKVGYAVDVGPTAVLRDAPADFRFERGQEGLILRADGCATGTVVTLDSAKETLRDMVHWFDRNRKQHRRMARLVDATPFPDVWQGRAPKSGTWSARPGRYEAQDFVLVGAAFGQITAQALVQMLDICPIDAFRVTPWRMIALPLPDVPDLQGFVTDRQDGRLTVNACYGAPLCPQSSVETRSVLTNIDLTGASGLHVSGCVKGCAHPRPAKATLVGRNGAFDLVCNGTAWDRPVKRGLSLQDALKESGID